MQNQPPSIFAERYPVALFTGVVGFLLLFGAAHVSYWWRGQPLMQPLKRLFVAWAAALSVLAVIAIGAKLAHYFS